MDKCSLCDSDLGPVLGRSEYWKLVLNKNQNLLGKCFLVLQRHLESVSLISMDEWMDLHEQIKRATLMLQLAFKPDHFNYAFLQNQDRHVHLHIIPRYAAWREFAGFKFTDPDYPAHYRVPVPLRQLSRDQFIALADHLSQVFAEMPED